MFSDYIFIIIQIYKSGYGNIIFYVFTKIKLEYSILITFQVLKLLQINLDSFYNNVLIWGLLSAHSSLVSTPLDDEMEKKQIITDRNQKVMWTWTGPSV